jgi:hypothetical protein
MVSGLDLEPVQDHTPLHWWTIGVPITVAASSSAQTLGSWFRIPLQAWMSVCAYSVLVLSYVQVVALRRANPPSKKSYRLCKRSRK